MRTVLMLAAFVAIMGCTTAPSVTKQKMTLGEANISGMECRREKPIDSNLPRTICASRQAWAAFDDARRIDTDDILAEGRKHANVGPFNRN
jgi:hypothetical protein